MHAGKSGPARTFPSQRAQAAFIGGRLGARSGEKPGWEWCGSYNILTPPNKKDRAESLQTSIACKNGGALGCRMQVVLGPFAFACQGQRTRSSLWLCEGVGEGSHPDQDRAAASVLLTGLCCSFPSLNLNCGHTELGKQKTGGGNTHSQSLFSSKQRQYHTSKCWPIRLCENVAWAVHLPPIVLIIGRLIEKI
jgi:hypothetical protein